MKKRILSVGILLFFAISSFTFAGVLPTYQTVPNDPMHSRIYTLSNGLKVYLSVNKQQPRIQTYVAVHVGSKNDPSETTGLSHYLEHLLFKGTSHFGTSNYTVEKPLLDQIRQLYEVYRRTTDTAQRKAIYHQIDSISYEASKYSIANEYDKLMTSIGSQGSNAFTSEDCTVYQENIPSNQVENWAKVEADRFSDAVIRGFHTELEAVYEEYNLDLTQDIRKVFDAMNHGLFPNHPYGQQTVIGTQNHLKNPSIVNIDNHFHTYYVPNNMAICMSGDFDPDQTIAIIDKYFSILKPNPSLPKIQIKPEQSITSPVIEKVIGPQAEQLALGWRFPAQHSAICDTLQVLDMILANGSAGLIDEDIVQKQMMLKANSYPNMMGDYSVYMMQGTPKQGQTLDNVKALFLKELGKLKKGEFSEELLKGSINQFKLRQMQILEDNEARASMFVESFTKDIPWADEVTRVDRLSKITKTDIVAFANRYFGNNYVAVYKEKGQDPNEKKIDKPAISPILTNRDKASEFLRTIQTSTIKPIEPVFVDFQKDLSLAKVKSGIQLLYKKNTLNDIFTIIYLLDRGSNNDKYLNFAAGYLNLLGTASMSNSEFNKKMYNLGCTFGVNATDEQTYISIYGLSENMKPAMKLVEDLLGHVIVDKAAYTSYVQNKIKERSDQKLDQGHNFSNLVDYVTYGGQHQKNMLSNEQMQQLNPQTLIDKIHHLFSYQHRILYYGPTSEVGTTQAINQMHQVPKVLRALPQEIIYNKIPTTDNKVYIAPYDAKNIYVNKISVSNTHHFSVETEPLRILYNSYFGGSMNSIVFQELRESRALAYSAYAYYRNGNRKNDSYSMNAVIITQNDKAKDALAAYQDILDNIPLVQANFDLSKQNVISQFRTNRTIGMGIIWKYLSAQKLGLNYDINKKIFDKLQGMTINDVANFQKSSVKGIKYNTAILGNEKELDLKSIAKYGTIVRLTQRQIFGY